MTAEDRYLVIRPREDHWRISGRLTASDGAIVERMLEARADEVPALPDGSTEARHRRLADALVMVCQDVARPADLGALLTLSGDLGVAMRTNGEAGVSVVGGPRVGPQTLEEILCVGSVEVNLTDAEGNVLGLGQVTKSTPPRLRRHVLARDGGCTAEGCTSRYRLQPHHIVPRHAGGTDDPTNLTTLCWFHHHRVIHGLGYEIDPASPPGRRRFVRRRSGCDPPDRNPLA